MRMASTTTSGFYGGSLLLEPFAKAVSLPIDQVNHFVCQLFSLLFGFAYRTTFSPARVSPTVRHGIQVTLGLSLLYFCFGRQTIHVIAQSLTCYLLMMYLKPGVMEKVVFVVSLGYLCLCHIYRQVYDYGGYTLDITGPLMINTQRLSSLAFALCDGIVDDREKLSPMLKKNAVQKLPTPLQFLSYTFCFHGIMIGPFVFYNDYVAFIEGTDQDATPKELLQNSGDKNGSNNYAGSKQRPKASPLRAIAGMLTISVISVALTLLVQPQFPVDYLTDPELSKRGFFAQVLYLVVSTTLVRPKYYLVWSLAESVNANCGLGFNGYDKSGNSKWDLISNANIFKIETGTSLKVVIDNWNITSTHWLRYVVYERVHSSLLVFIFSAVWHGFYPGYYVMFLTGAILVEAGRGIRRHIRPIFQTTATLRLTYEIITFIGTRVALAYFAMGFVLLTFWSTIIVYGHMFFFIHVLAFLVIATSSVLPKSKPNKPKTE